MIFNNEILGKAFYWSHLYGHAPIGSNFYLCEKHVSPPGLEPRCVEYRRSTLTTKQRSHDEEIASHQILK